MGSIKKQEKQIVRAIDQKRKKEEERRKKELIRAQQEASKVRRLAAIREEEEKRLEELSRNSQRRNSVKRAYVRLCSGAAALVLSVGACVYSHASKMDKLPVDKELDNSSIEHTIDQYNAQKENTVVVNSLTDGQKKEIAYSVSAIRTVNVAAENVQANTRSAQKSEHTHSFGEWKNNGKGEVRRCLECGEMEFRDHSFVSWKAENDTKEVSNCSTCDAISYRDHTYKVNNAQYYDTNPNYKGQHIACRDYECTTCGHTFQGWKLEDCTFDLENVTFDDEYDYRTCEMCNEVLATKHKLEAKKDSSNIYSCTNEGCEYQITKKNDHDDDDDYEYNSGSDKPESKPPVDDDRNQSIKDQDDNNGIGDGGIKDIIDEDEDLSGDMSDGSDITIEIPNGSSSDQSSVEGERETIIADSDLNNGIQSGGTKVIGEEEEAEKDLQVTSRIAELAAVRDILLATHEDSLDEAPVEKII